MSGIEHRKPVAFVLETAIWVVELSSHDLSLSCDVSGSAEPALVLYALGTPF